MDNKEIKKYLSQCNDKIINNDIVSVLFSGVGGQGILLATAIMAYACLCDDYDVKVTEVHGMAQRGGSVIGSVRFGKKVFSPVISEADIIVSLEKLESLRYIDKLKNNGIIIINDYEVLPISVFDGRFSYPHDISSKIKSFTSNFMLIKALEIAQKIGSEKTMNVILLGALSNFLPVKTQSWLKSLKKVVPKKVLDLNLKAFEIGKNLKK
ncbi:MAG: indolepyruvate oxidoreductase subunit beta [Candidatus Humimicrobiaceae bacterium]